uniref:Uncharacterized protein n=1 Tax=Rhizophagus irregularis (strain DAOM 181602 / DAOM 197198 / MUCL 43194) TaxID=747089 RepID=U9TFU8_RHIID
MASNAYHRPNHVQRKDKTSASNVIVEESSNLRTIHLFHPWMIVYFKLVNIVLFLESQYIAKPIQHLKSYKSSDVVKQNQKSTRLRRLSTLSKQFQPTTEFDSDIPLEVYAAMELAQNDREETATLEYRPLKQPQLIIQFGFTYSRSPTKETMSSY